LPFWDEIDDLGLALEKFDELEEYAEAWGSRPLKANPPPRYPTQPAAYAFPPFGDRGHDKPGQDRS